MKIFRKQKFVFDNRIHTFDKLEIKFSSIDFCCRSMFGNGRSNSLEAIERRTKQCSDATDRIKCPLND